MQIDCALILIKFLVIRNLSDFQSFSMTLNMIVVLLILSVVLLQETTMGPTVVLCGQQIFEFSWAISVD